MKKNLFTTLLTLATITATAQESQTAYNFLRVPVSAHAAALGGENISLIEDDASLALSNPALLSNVSHGALHLGYMNYMSGSNIFTASYTHAINEETTAGVAIHYLNHGSMTETDYYGQELGNFTPSDIAFEALLSRFLSERVTGGIAAKFIYSTIGSYTSTAAAIDLGINYYNPDNDFSASIAVKNLGGQLSAYDDEFEKLPLDIQVGVSKRFKNSPFRFHATLLNLNDWDYSFLRHLNIATDVILSRQFYAAIGYNLKRAEDMKIIAPKNEDDTGTHGAGLTLGAGLLLDRFKLNIAYGKYHVSSSSLMFNLQYTINK